MYTKGFHCFKCNTKYPLSLENNDRASNCPACGGMLLLDYDYSQIAKFIKKDDLRLRAANIWRYSELLPIREASNMISRGEGGTPILPLKSLGAELGQPYLYMKDESVLPFSTFRSRAAAVCVSRAKEAGVKTVAVRANSAQAYAWACYAAFAGLKLVLLSRHDSMLPQLRAAILTTGARLYLHEGDVFEAEKLVQRSAQARGWFHVCSQHDPFLLEGHKTIAFEVAEAFHWNLPATIICPADRDGMFRGMYRGLRELQAMGWIPPTLPRLVAVQGEDWSPVVAAWQEKKTEIVPPPPPPYEYIPEGQEKEITREDEALSFDSQSAAFVLDGIYKSLGCAVLVSEEEINAAKASLAAKEGIIAGRSGASTLAAAQRLQNEGWLDSSGHVLFLNPVQGLAEFPSMPPQGKLGGLIKPARDPLLVDVNEELLPE